MWIMANASSVVSTLRSSIRLRQVGTSIRRERRARTRACAEAYPTAANTSRLRRGEPANDARHRRLEASVGDSVGRGDVFLEAGLGVGEFAFELRHHLEPVALRLFVRAFGGSAHAFFRFSPCVGESVSGGRFGILDTTPCVDLGVDQT